MNKSVFFVGTRWFGVIHPCKKIIQKLQSAGFKIFIIGNRDELVEQSKYPDITFVELVIKRSYYNFFYDIFSLFKLCFLIYKFKPIFIHSFNPKPSIFAGIACYLFPKVKFLWGVTGLGNTYIKTKLIKLFVNLIFIILLFRAKNVCCQNIDDCNLLKKLNMRMAYKIFYFPGPGVDLSKFKYKKKEKTSTFRVIMIARLLGQKGISSLFKTLKWKNLVKENPDVEFYLFGSLDGEHPDSINKDELDLVIKNYNLNWVPWSQNINLEISKADLLLFLSDREGGPRAILEASAIGRPVIAKKAIGVSQFVINNTTGILLENDDPDNIWRSIFRLKNDTKLCENLGINGRKLIAERFSLENSSRAQLSMYSN